MTTTRLIIAISTLAFFSGCSHYVLNDSGYPRPPKKYKFSYSKNESHLTDTTIIDTTAIYYLSNSNYYRNSSNYKNTDHYIRFYSDGHYKLQAVKEYPKIEDINDIRKGNVGYYKLKGNVIKLQLYSDINAGSDQLQFGLIDENNNLVLLNENPRTDFCIGYSESGIKRKIRKASFFNPLFYTKIRLNGMTYDRPDW